jgi:hypothetical protein
MGALNSKLEALKSSISPAAAVQKMKSAKGGDPLAIVSCVDGSRIARINLMVWRGGRVQSCVRPVAAVYMTAGPDGMHG